MMQQLGLRNKHLVGLYLSLCLLLALSSGAEHHHIGLWLFTLFGAHSAWQTPPRRGSLRATPVPAHDVKIELS